MLCGRENSEVLKAAAEALGKLGQHAATVVRTLTECLKDKDGFVRRVASEAVARSRGDVEQGLGGRATEPGREGCAAARDMTVPRIQIDLTVCFADEKTRRCA